MCVLTANKYPFYGTQWHPEKNIYQWDVKSHINHTTSAVAVSQYMANFFVAQGSTFSLGSTLEHNVWW